MVIIRLSIPECSSNHHDYPTVSIYIYIYIYMYTTGCTMDIPLISYQILHLHFYQVFIINAINFATISGVDPSPRPLALALQILGLSGSLRRFLLTTVLSLGETGWG